MKVRGLGFGVWGLGFGVWGVGVGLLRRFAAARAILQGVARGGRQGCVPHLNRISVAFPQALHTPQSAFIFTIRSHPHYFNTNPSIQFHKPHFSNNSSIQNTPTSLQQQLPKPQFLTNYSNRNPVTIARPQAPARARTASQ